MYLGYACVEKYLSPPLDADPGGRADVLEYAWEHLIQQYDELSKIGAQSSEGAFLAIKVLVLRRNIDGAKTSIKQLFDTEINGYDDDVVYCHC